MSSIGESDLSIHDPGASARRMIAERRACDRVSTEALERGTITNALNICEVLADMAGKPQSVTADRLGAILARAKIVAEDLKIKE